MARKKPDRKPEQKAQWYQHIGAGLALAVSLLLGWGLWAAAIDSLKQGFFAALFSLLLVVVVTVLALGLVMVTLGAWAEVALLRLLSLASGEVHLDIAQEGARAWPKDLAALVFYLVVGAGLILWSATPAVVLLGLSSLALAGFACVSMILSGWVSTRRRDKKRPQGDSARLREGAGLAGWVVTTSVVSLMVGGALFEELPRLRSHGGPATLYEGTSIDFCIGQTDDCEQESKVIYFSVPQARQVKLRSWRGSLGGASPALSVRPEGAAEASPLEVKWRHAESHWELTLPAKPGVRYELLVTEARHHSIAWEASP